MVTVIESRDASNRVAVETTSGYIIVAMSRTTSCVPSVPPRSAPDIVISSPILYAVQPLVTVTLEIVPEESITKVNSAPVALVPAIDF